MTDFVIVRKIDKLGRIVLPKDFRTALRVGSGDRIEMCVKDGAIIIRKSQNKCSYTASEK